MLFRRLSEPGQVLSLPFAFCRTRAGLLALAVGFALAAGLGGGFAYAQAPEGSYDEEEAQAIDQMLMCPVCPAESIDQAQVPLARQMRQRVRELLAEGASRQEVLDYFADRYGQYVLASPPKSGFNLLAWILPIAGLVAALGAALLVLRAMQGRDSGPVVRETVAIEPEDSLEPYLAAVDRSLDLERARGADEEVEAADDTETNGFDEEPR
ncbi:MAG: cytochrome c-type biogenesis protein CcmH [Chloroflexota bacterium]|nr:cytochrome c-type biogenesis protein CcmH [Chloroflexota bacterium]